MSRNCFPQRASQVVLATVAIAISSSAHGGGPLFYTIAGEPVGWDPTTTVAYYTDLGPLGRMSNADAWLTVGICVSNWNAVDTASILAQRAGAAAVDIDVTNFGPYLGPYGGVFQPIGQSTVVFDADGAITALLYGEGAGVVGFAGPTFFQAGGEIVPLGNEIPPGARIVEGVAFLNGRVVDGIDDPSMGNWEISPQLFEVVVIHELGHFLGLAHTQIHGVNDHWRSDNRFPTQPVETMFPFLVDVGQGTLERDDRVALSVLYPTPEFIATTGTIVGHVFTSQGQPLMGINVVARNRADGADAVSTLSGEASVATLSGSAAARGAFRLPGVTPGAEYTVEVQEVDASFTGGSRIGPFLEPTVLPGPPEYYDAAEGSAPALDRPEAFLPLVVGAGAVVSGIDIIVNRQLFDVENNAYTVPSMTALQDFAVADFDHDGRPDLVGAKVGFPNESVWYRGAGNGRFVGPESIAQFPGNDFVVAGQFNSGTDSFVDFAVASSTMNEVHVHYWDGGGFAAATSVLDLPNWVPGPSLNMISGLERGDFDANGIDDLLVTYYDDVGPHTVYALLGSAAGDFSVVSTPFPINLGTGLTQRVVGDFVSGSGDDVVFTSGGLRLLVNDGGGGFTLQSIPSNFSRRLGGALATGDLNGDGHPDLALADYQPVGAQPNWTRSYISVVLGDGAGHFAFSTRYDVPDPFQEDMLIADVDGDGAPDVASTGFGAGVSPGAKASIGFGNGTGGIRDVTTVWGLTEIPSLGFAAADFDGDSRTDLVVNKGFGTGFFSDNNPGSTLLNRIDQTTPVAIESFAAAIEAQIVRLTWRVGNGLGAALHIERGPAAAGPWVELARLGPDVASFEDRDVIANGTYWYRLVLATERGAVTGAGPIQVVLDGVARTELVVAHAAGSRDDVSIRYTIGGSTAGSVTLVLYDVRGRVVRSLYQGNRPPGAYMQTWDRRDGSGAAVGRGVYLVQLRTDVRRLTKKVVLAAR